VAEAQPAVVLSRRFAAPPERVFRAWVEPEQLVRWQFPDRGTRLEVAAFDAQRGGAYEFRFHAADGRIDTVRGSFIELVPPKRLVFTWRWDTNDPDGGVESRVSVDLVPDGGGTRLTVSHERLPTANSCRRHQLGWTGALGHLAELFEQATRGLR
jgi:uncharacterized protein YndB with AHSA1/START domain